ncbi:MAG TPA: alpha/beta hydrolase-fold protein [Acidimicrobiales bacterium]|nr:alpha/beta hydrolase-fold protein [Acidimicrobiales bacterium]
MPFRLLLTILSAGVVIFGVVGTWRYVETFWLYRGFPPPRATKSVLVGSGRGARRVTVHHGVVSSIELPIPALGGKDLRVLVYTPPGYDARGSARYPTLYLLHGHPGGPDQFVQVGDLATTSDVLIARRRIRPMIVVMPSGTTSFFVDHEWVNANQPDQAWESYVANDLVQAIDRRYLTVPVGADRAIGGLSEGGYGALNIAFHHPGEFNVIESWSGYYGADRRSGLFGSSRALLAYNSPISEVAVVAQKLRNANTFIWFYTSTSDRTVKRSEQFAKTLSDLHIDHAYFEPSGRHDWALWRAFTGRSLIAASSHLRAVHAT